MYHIVAVENITADGVVQGAGRPDEDTRGGFEHGGWATRFYERDPEAAMTPMQGSDPAAALLFGHRTYDDLVGHWLSTDEPNPFAEILRETPKYVASRSDDTELPWPNSNLLAGDAADTVAELKLRGEGPMVILGSIELVRDLAAAGLIDELVLSTIPVVLGSGTRLFEGGSPVDLEVTKSVTSKAGSVTSWSKVR